MWQYTLIQLQAMMDSGQLSSVELVQSCLEQIHRLNDRFRPVAAINSDAVNEARARDLERKNSGSRSPLHGIPILVKDNIFTKYDLPTTASSYALRNFLPNQNARIIDQLVQAGAIILGKTNMSEWAYFMSEEAPSGYGSLNGQVTHPYDDKIDPYGSSTGSAVAIALLMAPVAIGTETNGSLIAPAYQTYTVAMKPTHGLLSTEGIIPLSLKQDTAGPMARHVADIAMLMHYLQTNYMHKIDFTQYDHISLKNKKVAVLRLRSVRYSVTEEEILLNATKHFVNAGLAVTTLEIDDQPMDNYTNLLVEFKHDINNFLAEYGPKFGIKSLDELITYNKENASQCLKFGQSILEKSNATSGNLSSSEYLNHYHRLLEEAHRLGELMKVHGIDVVFSTQWFSYAPVSGMPTITVPARYAGTGAPLGLVFIGHQWQDDLLLAIAKVYEQSTNYFIPPEVALP